MPSAAILSTDPATLTQRIEDTVRELEHASRVPAWVVASSSSILAAAYGVDEAYGPRGRMLHAVFRRLGPSWWAVQALRALGIGVTLAWLLRALAVRRLDATATDLFVGFGAGPEDQMYEEFKAEGRGQVAHLDQTDPRSLAKVAHPGAWMLAATAWREAEILVRALRDSPAPCVQQRVREWLTSAAIRFCAYVYAKAWAEALPSTVRRMVFLSPDIPAFAALDGRPPVGGPLVEFREHGLLQHSNLIPRFDSMVALNLPEADHLRSRVPSARVTMRSAAFDRGGAQRERTLLFASVYDYAGFRREAHVQSIRAVFAWAAEEGLRVVVRPHPRESAEFWALHFPQIELDLARRNFSECLVHWRPLFVISWFSTALMDALACRALPILLRQGSETMLPDLVLPLEQLTMNWPADRRVLSRLAGTPQAYRELLGQWRLSVFGVRDGDVTAGNANSRS